MEDLRRRNGAEHVEKRIDDIVLSHKDGAKEVGDDNGGDLLRVGSSHYNGNKHTHVGQEHYSEKAAIKSEDLVT